MTAKSSPEKWPRLNVRTAEEVVQRAKHAAADLGAERWQFRERRLSLEALVGAVVLEFCDLDREAQRAVLSRGIPKLERLLEIDVSPQPTFAARDRPGVVQIPVDQVPAPGAKKADGKPALKRRRKAE